MFRQTILCLPQLLSTEEGRRFFQNLSVNYLLSLVKHSNGHEKVEVFFWIRLGFYRKRLLVTDMLYSLLIGFRLWPYSCWVVQELIPKGSNFLASFPITETKCMIPRLLAPVLLSRPLINRKVTWLLVWRWGATEQVQMIHWWMIKWRVSRTKLLLLFRGALWAEWTS